jgi:hypothetical protein
LIRGTVDDDFGGMPLEIVKPDDFLLCRTCFPEAPRLRLRRLAGARRATDAKILTVLDSVLHRCPQSDGLGSDEHTAMVDGKTGQCLLMDVDAGIDICERMLWNEIVRGQLGTLGRW